MLGTSRLTHLGVSGPFSSLGPVSSHVDAAALDNSARISPDNNLDFYAYSQAAPYSVKLIIFILNKIKIQLKINS
ncbi:unnamed protein product [Rotaria sp. Silwood2]|nr:unnamed protein product [Rotaria sp. Silwood2]